MAAARRSSSRGRTGSCSRSPAGGRSQGEVVFHRDDPAESLHLIVRGRFAARVASQVGDSVLLDVLGPGQAFGELALLLPGERRSATVSALEEGETRSVFRDDFARLQREPSRREGRASAAARRAGSPDERPDRGGAPRRCRHARPQATLRARRVVRHWRRAAGRSADAGGSRRDSRDLAGDRESGPTRGREAGSRRAHAWTREVLDAQRSCSAADWRAREHAAPRAQGRDRPFCDLVGFTQRAEEMDPEDVAALLGPYHVEASKRSSSGSEAQSRSSSATP